MWVCVDVGYRWRNSFLFSLLFGIPVMAVMIYFMVTMASATCPADSDDDDVSSDVSTTTVNVMTTTKSTEDCDSHMIMLLPGLSLENLLFFLLCTPCQVCLIYYCWYSVLRTFIDKSVCSEVTVMLLYFSDVTLSFLLHEAMHSADYAVARCLPSETARHIKLFHLRVATPF